MADARAEGETTISAHYHGCQHGAIVATDRFPADLPIPDIALRLAVHGLWFQGRVGDPDTVPLSFAGGLTHAVDGLAVDRAVIAPFAVGYVAWVNALSVASSNPGDPVPVPSGKPSTLGPGGPVVIAQ